MNENNMTSGEPSVCLFVVGSQFSKQGIRECLCPKLLVVGCQSAMT
jgi:hypothetical protein